MDLYKQDPVASRALALALMRQALEILDAVNEHGAAVHLQLSIDTLLTPRSSHEKSGSEKRQ